MTLLTLQNNAIATIEAGAFDGAPNLHVLNLVDTSALSRAETLSLDACRAMSTQVSSLPLSLLELELHAVFLQGTPICASGTPVLDSAFDDLVASSLIRCSDS